MITTIFPQPLASASATGIRNTVLGFLQQHPEKPFSFGELARQLQLSQAQIEQAVAELEGPLDRPDQTADAYLHRARCSAQAVYIP